VFAIEAVPPFRLDLTVWAVRRRADNLVDRWDGRVYRRVLVLEGAPVEIAVTQPGGHGDARLQVAVTGGCVPPDAQPLVTASLERLLGLRTNLAGFYRLAAGDARLGPLAQRFRGLKPTRFPTVFETLINAIACQQVTLTQGIRLLNRLAATYGSATGGEPDAPHALPGPARVAALDPEAFRALAFSRQKARALHELAREVVEGRLDLERLAALDDATALAKLCTLRGVGRWTAEYVLLRGLGRLHVFPGDDVGARNNLRRWLGLPEPLDYEGVRRVVAQWEPYAGLVYFHLLLEGLAAGGYLATGRPEA
jgi:DNA-3-methyladenine glycosylase II